MNKAVIVMGIAILLFSAYPIFYTSSTSIENPDCVAWAQNHAASPCPYPRFLTLTASPYYYYGLMVALIGVVASVIGFAIPKQE
jgi:hypothetical protein